MYTYKHEKGLYYITNNGRQLFTPAKSEVYTASQILADDLLKDLKTYGEDPSNICSIVAFHYAYIDFYRNYPRKTIESNIASGLDKNVDWTFQNHEDIRVNDTIKTFGKYEEQTEKCKDWLSKISLHQLAAVCVVGRALESVNIAYLAAEIYKEDGLDSLVNLVYKFYPYVSKTALKKHFTKFLMYFTIPEDPAPNIISGSLNKTTKVVKSLNSNEINNKHITVNKFAEKAEEILIKSGMDTVNLEAIWSLSLRFEEGNSEIRKDELVAFTLACFAAQKGFGEAQNQVGYCFDNGIIVKEDKVEAFYWFEKAALNNNELAFFNLGDAYYYGYGVEIDHELARKWYLLAAEKGIKEASEMLKKLESENENNSLAAQHIKTNFVDLLIQEAKRQGWLSSIELRYIPELISMQNNATEYLLKFMFEQQEESSMLATLTFHMTRYLFAKSIEAVIAWGHSKDGKISIYYHTKHLIDKQLEFEIPEIYQKYALEGINVGESLFNIYNDFLNEKNKNSVKIDLYSSTKDLFNWIQKLGIHYALENKYEMLWR